MQIAIPTEERLLLSPGEAALKLGCSPRTVWTLIQRGDLESVKLGQLRKIPADALIEYVNRLRKQPSLPGGDAA